jgi:hypothetical protein
MNTNDGNMGYPCHYPSNLLDRINKNHKNIQDKRYILVTPGINPFAVNKYYYYIP